MSIIFDVLGHLLCRHHCTLQGLVREVVKCEILQRKGAAAQADLGLSRVMRHLPAV